MHHVSRALHAHLSLRSDHAAVPGSEPAVGKARGQTLSVALSPTSLETTFFVCPNNSVHFEKRDIISRGRYLKS